MNRSFFAFLLRCLILFLFWIALSGKLDRFHLGLGLFSAAVISFFAASGRPGGEISAYLTRLPGICLRGIAYLAWLLGRVILAALHVSRLILDPRMPIAPRLIRHRTFLRDDYARVLFANSITLTPGTITADLKDGEYVVHALDEDSASDIVTGAMERHIAPVFGEESPA